LGYIFNESYWHQGYAVESATACMIYAFDVLRVDEVTAQIRPDNLNSLKVAQKLGLEVKKPFIRRYRGRDIPHLLLSRTKSKKRT
jgi:RimJ/RimL family protein N-acetyltransferase